MIISYHRSSINDIRLFLLQEWMDYDEKQKESVGVYELEHKFVTVK